MLDLTDYLSYCWCFGIPKPRLPFYIRLCHISAFRSLHACCHNPTPLPLLRNDTVREHAMPWPSATRHLRQGLGLVADKDARARNSSAMLWVPHRYQVGRIAGNQRIPLTAVQ